MFFNSVPKIIPSHKWIERGDLPANDYDENDLTQDNNYYTLDISGIVGVGKRLVLLSCRMIEDQGNKAVTMDTNGQTYHINASIHRTQFANITYQFNAWVYTDADGKIEYRYESGTWGVTRISVRGWFELV